MRILARGFGWRWNGRRAHAVRGVDLDVASGERVLLLGPSGAGKSTLLAAAAGLLDGGEQGAGEQEGELLLDGVPARTARASALDDARGLARTGLLLQDPQAQTVLARCGDDVAFGLENHSVPRAQIWPRVDRALADVELPVDRARSTARLSGGERQRLALAGVLALSPQLLLLDEPTAMLDPAGARRLRDVVGRRLDATGAGCLLVEHRVDLWVDLVDRVVVLAPGGGLLADGSPAEVLSTHGTRLAEAGVWVPGHAPRRRVAPDGRVLAPDPPRPSAAAPASGVALPSGDLLLELAGVAVGHRAGFFSARPRGTDAPSVLAGVDAQVRAGRAIAVRGANGAGKSTLALALAGLRAPLAGRLRAAPALADGAGDDPVRWRPSRLVTRIGSVFQDPRHQFVAATVADELAVGPRRGGVPEAEVADRVGALLERLRLGHLAAANPFTLSGGEQRRLSVGTALAARPRLLVLDEPTFGQDARTWAELVDLLAEALEAGTAVVAATHDDALAAAVADEVWEVAAGRVTTARPARPPVRPPAATGPAAGPAAGSGVRR